MEVIQEPEMSASTVIGECLEQQYLNRPMLMFFYRFGLCYVSDLIVIAQ